MYSKTQHYQDFRFCHKGMTQAWAEGFMPWPTVWRPFVNGLVVQRMMDFDSPYHKAWVDYYATKQSK